MYCLLNTKKIMVHNFQEINFHDLATILTAIASILREVRKIRENQKNQEN